METIAGAFEDYEGRVLLDGRDARDIAVQDRGIGISYSRPGDYFLRLDWARRIGLTKPCRA